MSVMNSWLKELRKKLMEKEKIYFDPDAVCEGCGKKMAFVYNDDDGEHIFCLSCMGITFEIVEKEKE